MCLDELVWELTVKYCCKHIRVTTSAGMEQIVMSGMADVFGLLAFFVPCALRACEELVGAVAVLSGLETIV